MTTRRILAAILLGIPVSSAVAQQSPPGEPLPAAPIEELTPTRWPPELPSLEVVITPRGIEPESETAPEAPGWAAVPLDDGRTGNLLDFLSARYVHEPGWVGDAASAARVEAMVPPTGMPDGRRRLVEHADLAVMLGGGFLGMTMAQIYVHFGFLPDGTRPTNTGRGVYAPLDPIDCPEGGISCRETILDDGARRPDPSGGL